MPNLLQKSSDWLEEMRNKHLVTPVTYCRNDECINIKATIGKTVFQIAREMGPFERFESRDFLITASGLTLKGNPALPSRGDRIKETLDGNVYEYEVMAPGSEPCWRWSDAYHRTLRIHTKLIATEPTNNP